MSRIAYYVTATLPDVQTAEEYIAWLSDGHIDAVVRGGAMSGEIVRKTDPPFPIQVQTRYVFANMESFDSYVREHAPGLRAEGLARFPPERAIKFERMVGEIVHASGGKDR